MPLEQGDPVCAMSKTMTLAAKKQEAAPHAQRTPRLAMCLRIAVATAAALGVAVGSVFSGVTQGDFNSFSTYSIQSNLIVAVVFMLSAVEAYKDFNSWKTLGIIRRSACLWIYVTGLGFHFLVASNGRPAGLQGLGNILLHYAVPVGVFATWVLSEPKGCYRLRECWIWVSYPLLYEGVSLLRGRLDGFYPYWFLDPNKAGTGGVLLWVGALTAALIAMGLLLTGLDTILARVQKQS